MEIRVIIFTVWQYLSKESFCKVPSVKTYFFIVLVCRIIWNKSRNDKSDCHFAVGWERQLYVQSRRMLSQFIFRKLQSQERSLDASLENESLHSVGVDAFPFYACQRKWYCVFINLAYWTEVWLPILRKFWSNILHPCHLFSYHFIMGRIKIWMLPGRVCFEEGLKKRIEECQTGLQA